MKRSFLLAGFSASVLAACVTAPPPPPPAVLSFTPQAPCTASVSVAAPMSLTPEDPAASVAKIVKIDATTPCLKDGSGAQKPYAVFALPTAGEVASVNAGAVIESSRLFAPAVFTLGADNSIRRTFGQEALTRRGRTLSVLFRPVADERYVVIATDPAVVGQRMPLVSVDPASAEVPAHLTGKGGVDADTYRGGLSVPYSYEGQVFARVYFADPGTPVSPPARSSARRR